MKLSRLLTTFSLALFAASSIQARESALLRNGFSISHDHHQQMGSIVRLFLSSSEAEYIDVPSENIVSYEPEPALPSPKLNTVANTSAQLQPDLKLIVEKAASENQLDADFIRAVIHAESNGKSTALSPKGAQGLMQLMPQTAMKLGVTNSFDPSENVNAGARYLRELLARYHNDPIRALAAYNAGAGRVEQYHGVPPYRETRAYVGTIIRDFNHRKVDQERAAKLTNQSGKPAAAKVSDGN